MYENYINIAIQEIRNPKFASTRQYLEIMEVKEENGIPKVVRIQDNFDKGFIDIYFI